MKKIVAAIVVLLVIAGVFALLFSNRAARQAKAKSVEIMTVFPVSAAQVVKEKIDENLSLIGTVYANAEVNMLSDVQGRIVTLNFDVGQRVGKGQELCRLDDELKKAQLESAEVTFEKAKKDYERYKQLLSEKTVNEVQYESAKLAYATANASLTTARRQLNDMHIKSPISGIVTTRNVEVGSFLNMGNPIAYIVDISTLRIKLNVPEKDAFKIKEGDIVNITTDIYPDAVFQGRIKSIAAKADDAHAFPVEIIMQNSSSQPFRAGMFARVNFNSVKKSETIVIPRTALVGSAREPQVYVIEDNIAKLRNITLGVESGDKLEVLSGLNPGETVVTNGQINLQNNVQVKIVK